MVGMGRKGTGGRGDRTGEKKKKRTEIQQDTQSSAATKDPAAVSKKPAATGAHFVTSPAST